MWAGSDYNLFAESLGCEYGRTLYEYFGVADEARPAFELKELVVSSNKKIVCVQLQPLIIRDYSIRADFQDTVKIYDAMILDMGTKYSLNV